MKLIGYTRVSTDGQTDGFGVDVQRQVSVSYAKNHGHNIVAWCDDVIPGTVDGIERYGFSCVIDHLEASDAEGVIMSTLDRLGRRLIVSEAALAVLRNAGAQVFTADHGEIGEADEDETRILIRQVLGAIAEFEARRVVKRLKAGRALKAEGGGFAYGAPAFGQRAEDGELTDDQAEQTVIARIRAKHQQGQSIRAICVDLNAAGITSKRGGAWHPTTVARVLDKAK